MPTEEEIAAAQAAATAASQAELQKAVDALATKLASGVEGAVERARAEAASAVKPVAAPAYTPEDFAVSIDAAIEKSGGKVGPAVVEALGKVAPAILNANAAGLAAIRKDQALADPALRDPKGVPLMKRFEKEISAYIRDKGITDAYLQTAGYTDIVTLIAAKDATLAAEKQAAVIADYEKQRQAESGKVGAPRVEGVHAGPITTPGKPAPTVEEEIAAIKVDPEQVALLSQRYRLTEGDTKRQKWEIAQQYEKHGTQGIRQLGGVPICNFEDVPIEPPVPGREQRKVHVELLD